MKRSLIVFLVACLCFCVMLSGCAGSEQQEEMSNMSETHEQVSTTSSAATGNTTTSSSSTTTTKKPSSSTTTAQKPSSSTKKTTTTTTKITTTTTAIPLPSTEKMVQDMKGLNVLAFGDSLFRGTAANANKGTPDVTGEKVWINRLAKQCDWNITNLGIGGMTVSLTAANKANNKHSMYDNLFNKTDFVFGSSNSTYYQSGDTNKPASEVDVIFLLGGANDYSADNNVPLGKVNSKDQGTFLGAWNLITEKLMKDYPNASIIFLTSWELDLNNRKDGITSMQYSTSIKDLYEENYAFRKRITLIDMGNPAVSGAQMTNKAWRDQYSFDRLHLKEEGMKVVCSNMLPHIWRALKETETL